MNDPVWQAGFTRGRTKGYAAGRKNALRDLDAWIRQRHTEEPKPTAGWTRALRAVIRHMKEMEP